MSRLDGRQSSPATAKSCAANTREHLRQVTDFVEAVAAQVSAEVYRRGNSPRNLEAVREAVMKAVDVAAWRRKFAGDDKENREFFDGFSMPGLVTAAYREAWGN